MVLGFDLSTLAVDGVRLVHLGAMAVGLGTMVSTDLMTLRRAGQPVTAEFCRAVHSAHSIMAPALLVAWLSGVALLVIRTGLDPALFTPKLWAKLIVVTLLTATAWAVKRLVMPLLRLNTGRTLMETPRGDKLIMAACAALSMAGWTTALLLGTVGALKTAPGWVLALLLGTVYAAALAIAFWQAQRLHARITGDADRLGRMTVRP